MEKRVIGSRPNSSVRTDSAPSGLRKSLTIATAGVLVVVLSWAFWPSATSNVKNLDSRGSNVIAFGDSLTAGYGAAADEAYPSRLSSMAGIAIQNAGVSGDTTQAALARLDRDVLSRNPRIVIVGLGGNDFLRRVALSSTESNLRTIVRQIQNSGAMVVLLGFAFPSLDSDYEAMYERVADDEQCLLIPDLLDGILSNPSLKGDDIHPNGRGYHLMAERISGPVMKLIRKADASR